MRRVEVPAGTEREALGGYLDRQRAALVKTLDGLTDEEARSTPTVSSLSLLGLLKHKTLWEKRWFQTVVDGRMVPGLFDAANRVAGQVEKVMGQVEKLMTDTTVKNFAATADNAQVASRDMRRLLVDVSAAVAEQRKTLATLEASLQKSAVGLERVTTGPELDRALKRLDTLGERMDTVTASLQRSSESVETVAARAAKGEGSLGKLMTDEELYRDLNQTVNNLNEATLSLNRLLDDIQKNPKKYINLKVF